MCTWWQVQGLSHELNERLDHVFDSTSKLKGDPLPFLGSRVTSDGFWEVCSSSYEVVIS